MKYGILIFPGGYGDIDLLHVLEHHFEKEVKSIWYKDEGPFDVDILLIPGGFPCKDSSSGFECFRDSPALNYLTDFAEEGKIIVGFGNGFQLLCEAGLLPGRLNRNSSGRYICKHVFIKPDNGNEIITNRLNNGNPYSIPISTFNGNYEASDAELVQMRQGQQIVFRYCDHTGTITESVNYTGSVDNIAAVCNEKRNVYGMIPLPERGFVEYSTSSDGRKILESLISHFR